MRVPVKVILVSLVCNVCTSEIITKSFKWTKLDDLLGFGWTQSQSYPARVYKSPADMDARLLNLNTNFTDEVWGDSYKNNYFQLQTATLPMFCGLINATLDVKLFITNGLGSNYIYPVVGYQPSYTRPIEHTPGTVRWQTISSVLNVSETEFHQRFEISYNLRSGELIVFDEISLAFTVQQDEENCPLYCNHDCDYRVLGCHYYYTCVDRMYKEIHNCSAENGLAFNPVTKNCDYQENVEGCHSYRGECECAFKPHETNNTLYYFCANSCQPEECEERHCPEGMTWKMDRDGNQKCTP